MAGDEAGVISAKNSRKAESAIKGQLAALEAKLVDEESNVEDAQSALEDAIFPTKLISDNGAYNTSVRKAQEYLDETTKRLDDTKYSIEYNTKLLKKISEEVKEA